MMPPGLANELRRSLKQTGWPTRLTVFSLWTQALAHAKRGNNTQAMAYFGAGIAALNSRTAWLIIDGFRVADAMWDAFHPSQ